MELRAAPGAAEAAPLTETMLPVGDGHEIHVETVGRADGLPAVFLHGGPGSGCRPEHRRLFRPDVFRAVLFDQRGSGRSRPHGARQANTTQQLVADMERIREALSIDRWLLVGGSWGATLALAYAVSHPERVSGMVLRATFLGTRAELDWAFGTGLARFHPSLHRDFLERLPADERHAPLDAYWRRILDPDPAVHMPAALAWHDAERILSEHVPQGDRLAAREAGGPRPSTPFMEAHYFSNGCFLEEGELLAGAGRLAGIPGVLIQGRYDLLCPPSTAAALAGAWSGSTLRIVEGAGHAMSQPAVFEAVRAAVDAFAP